MQQPVESCPMVLAKQLDALIQESERKRIKTKGVEQHVFGQRNVGHRLDLTQRSIPSRLCAVALAQEVLPEHPKGIVPKGIMRQSSPASRIGQAFKILKPCPIGS